MAAGTLIGTSLFGGAFRRFGVLAGSRGCARFGQWLCHAGGMGTTRRAIGATRIAALLAVAVLVATACAGDDAAAPATSSIPPVTEPAPTTEPPPSSTSTTTTAAPAASTSTTTTTVPVPTHVDANGFDDHTVPVIASTAEYHALSKDADGRETVKFIIAGLRDEQPSVHWADAGFYRLHDEWYWFRRLNGQPIPGLADPPVSGLEFATIADVYSWAEDLSRLPADLRWVDGGVGLGRESRRLYANRFYEVTLRSEPRSHAAGSLIRFEHADGVSWLIELEYGDEPTSAELGRIFEVLASTLPSEIGDDLAWVLRSPAQRRIAEAMAAVDDPLADRIVDYQDLIEPGVVTVYNEGVAAGRLLLVDDAGANLALAGPDDVLVMRSAPDWLPPGRALITADPQTPLAHVNLLARDRGIPNLSIAGITENAAVQQAARIRARVVVEVVDGEVRIHPIERTEYDRWRDLLTVPPVNVPEAGPTDPGFGALVVSLDDVVASSDADLEPWRRVIGGKAAGFRTLLDADVPTPPDVVALTIFPYQRHLAQVQPALTTMLGHREFRDDVRVRFLLLEGLDDYREVFVGALDIAFGDDFVAAHPPGTVLGDIIDAGGFKKYFRAAPMASDDLAAIETALADHFDDYSPTQGLRFRSSSTVEDIEGFVGAGLYDSNTGFFDAAEGRSIEAAIKKTWASYWSFEAVEERRREAIDHESGAMAVVVHARFDDDLEVANGVATVTLHPDGTVTALVNAQVGAVSVANPDPTSAERAEQRQIVVDADGQRRNELLVASTLAEGDVLDATTTDALVDDLVAVAALWRTRVNADLDAAQQITTLTLDIEFKLMDAGWPDRTAGPTVTGLVLKQARSLEPGLRGVPAEALAAPVPHDHLARAIRIERLRCGDDGVAWRLEFDPARRADIMVESSAVYPAAIDPAACRSTVVMTTAEAYLVQLLDGELARSLID